VSLLLLALLLFLLFGGSRVGAAGKGLGEAVRHVKKAVGGDTAPAVDLPPMTALPEPQAPKLLPAKGESSAPADLDTPALVATKDDDR
jgi:Sec-independent protein translocase protein TatA